MVDPSAGPATDDLEPDEAEGSAEPWNAAAERRQSSVPVGLHRQRLDKAVVLMAPEFSRSHLQHLIEQGHVSVEGHPASSASRKVLAGQRIEVVLAPTAESRAFRPEKIDLNVIYEDEHLLIVDKPAGMVVHPAAGNWTGTLLNGLLARLEAAARLPRAGIVHRLDKDTSGLMVVGKTLAAVTALVRDIAARRVHREYLAIVHGRVPLEGFSIDAPIGRDPRSRIRMAVVPSGKPARTDVACVAACDGFSALRCTLHTGRTHQIRVHLASRGHPLVADATYGGKPALGMQRQALHAVRLSFSHPVSGVEVAFGAPAPPDLADAWLAVAGRSSQPPRAGTDGAGRAHGYNG
jgi:23S rRNA pseudouridine1911/1915/1917 synthase